MSRLARERREQLALRIVVAAANRRRRERGEGERCCSPEFCDGTPDECWGCPFRREEG